MSSNSSSNSFEDNGSRVFKDPETISFSLLMDLDSHGGNSYGDIPRGFQSPSSPAPYTNHVETNLAILARVASEEVANMMGEDVNPAPSPVAVGLRRGRKKKSEKEREEFWSRRPDWLPEGWEMDVRLRKDGATAGIRDRYYHEPRSGRRFRSRKEVEKFIQTGEVPRYKPKPKIEESNIENISSQNSEPTPSSNIAWPLTLEFYGKQLPSFMGGGKSSQQSEVGGTIIEQYETESTIGIQQPVLGIEQSKASSSRTKRGTSKIDRDLFERIGRERYKMPIFANSKTDTAEEDIASLEPVQSVKRIVQVASLPPATPQARHIL
ncbi:methyl-CpG-binding domain-containing protein 5 isoform X3 [Cinnamomum micranthum f. kanehirae]|uniref:Methyl-CpG-binding domain-containing protein 5 isoform X3 n=1 Tax=Cinnamomum micranthum f. kanehirae TaxID=337451 RepID=A0A443P3B4_9MAGN|nr:methyl-CpG-binding domain-containing protein 5 isoform X3 [Cinnamomum micranthum f. kanehirae]